MSSAQEEKTSFWLASGSSVSSGSEASRRSNSKAALCIVPRAMLAGYDSVIAPACSVGYAVGSAR